MLQWILKDLPLWLLAQWDWLQNLSSSPWGAQRPFSPPLAFLPPHDPGVSGLLLRKHIPRQSLKTGLWSALRRLASESVLDGFEGGRRQMEGGLDVGSGAVAGEVFFGRVFVPLWPSCHPSVPFPSLSMVVLLSCPPPTSRCLFLPARDCSEEEGEDGGVWSRASCAIRLQH